MTRTRGRGPSTCPTPATSTRDPARDPRQHSRGARDRGLVAVGIWYPPAGRRRHGAIVVRTCPACRHMHLHRSDGPVTSTTRTGSCGAEYTIRVVQVGGVA